MENAVKALYMAAAMLIAVMIMGLLIYLFKTGSLFGSNYELKKGQEQKDQFNAKFEVYLRGVETKPTLNNLYYGGNSIFDIITVSNLAYDVNEKNYNDNKNRVEIQVNIKDQQYSIGIIHKTDDESHKIDELSNILEKNSFFIGAIPANPNNETSRQTKLMDDLLIENQDSTEGSTPKKLTDSVLNYSSSLEAKGIPLKRTIYRYYFNCDNIEYSEITGKVNKMIFTAVENTGETFMKLYNGEEIEI